MSDIVERLRGRTGPDWDEADEAAREISTLRQQVTDLRVNLANADDINATLRQKLGEAGQIGVACAIKSGQNEHRAKIAERRLAALEAENAALIHDNARYVDAAAALATESERLRGELAKVKEAMTAEIHLIRHFADGIREGNYLDQRLHLLQHIDRLAALTGDPATKGSAGE